MCGRCLEGGGKRNPFYLAIAVPEQLISAQLDPVGHIGVGGSALRRVVFETAIGRWVVRWGHDDAVGKTFFSVSVVDENCSRDGRRGRKTISALDDGLHSVRGEYFESRLLRGSGYGVGILAHVERSRNLPADAVVADRLRDCENMRLIEGVIER